MKQEMLRTFPVVLTISMAWFFQLLVAGVVLPQPVITPLPETEGRDVSGLLTPTPYVNSLIVVGVMFAGSFALIMLMKYRRLIRIVLAVVFFTASWAASMFYLLIGTSLQEDVVFISSILFASLATAGIFSKYEYAGVLSSSFLSSASGVIIGSSIPFWTSVVMLAAVSLYDLAAVFKGHLKRLGEADISVIKGLVVDFRGVTIGLGDLFFYSILLSVCIVDFGLIPGVAASAGLVAGFVATLRLARKRPIFPGLPLTLTVALAAAGMTYLLL